MIRPPSLEPDSRLRVALRPHRLAFFIAALACVFASAAFAQRRNTRKPAVLAARKPLASNRLSQADKQRGFKLLFDGKTTNGWRGYRASAMPAGWRVEDGALTRAAKGGDIVTQAQFANFELLLDWKVAPGGNSGIMFRVTEDAPNSYETGPEMQVLDDERHSDGRSRLTAAGAAYGLYPAPAGAVKPAGEWNHVRLIVNGARVQQWLNGVSTADYELWGPEWEKRVKQSKFGDMPKFGRAKSGHIALQDHGDWVAYRDIKLREIK